MKRMLALSVSFAFGGIVMLFSAMAEEVYNVHELNIVANGTFEQGTVCSKGYEYSYDAVKDGVVLPTGWTFSSARSGISKTTDNTWHQIGSAAAVSGSNWAVFLQDWEYGDGGSVEQDVTFPSAGSYTMEFMWISRLSQRNLCVEILFGEESVKTITRDASNCPYTAYEKIEFTVDIAAAGRKRLKIVQKKGYAAFCIDQIAIYPTPTFEVSVQGTAMLGDNGMAEPIPVVTDKKTGATLVAGTDYSVSYIDNDSFGTGTVRVRGLSPHVGVIDKTFEIAAVYFAVPDAEVNEENQSGVSWGTATTYTNALKKIAQDGGELWLKEGRYPLVASPDVFTSTKEVRIRGGFLGNETSLAQRPTGLMTIIDGQDAVQTLKVKYAKTPSLFYIERMSFQHSAGKGLYAEILTANETDNIDEKRVFIVDCDFSNNTTFGSEQPNKGLGLYLKIGAASCVISNCTFQGNVSADAGNRYGYGACFDWGPYASNGRVFLEGCSFITNGCNAVNGDTASIGAAFFTELKAMTIRDCKFIGNRSAVHGNGGIVVFAKKSVGGHAITNCVFTGNEMVKGGGTQGTASGVIVVRYDEAKDNEVDVANCTFAYNIAANHSTAACAATVSAGKLHFINSIFYGNVINYSASGGADLSVTSANGSISAEYSLFDVTADPKVIDTNNKKLCRHHFNLTAYDAKYITLGDGNVYGDPDFVTEVDEFCSLGTNIKSPKLLSPTGTSPSFDEMFSPALLSLNVHLRGGSGYTDEVTGEHRVYPGKSIAIDVGDPQSDYSNEPSPNGKRVNLGAYGNTPYATRSSYAAFRIIVR